MSSITGFGALDALARTLPGAQAIGGPSAARSWFDGLTSPHEAVLRGEVEPAARGLHVQEHAQRVLGSLLDERG